MRNFRSLILAILFIAGFSSSAYSETYLALGLAHRFLGITAGSSLVVPLHQITEMSARIIPLLMDLKWVISGTISSFEDLNLDLS